MNHYDPLYDVVPYLPDMDDLTPEERRDVCTRSCLYGCLTYVVAAILFILLCACLTGCKTKTVLVETVRTDTLTITRLQRDSIMLHDSIYVHEHQRGDTVFLEVNRWHTQYRDRWHHDSIYIATHDTIPRPYPVEKFVEKKLTRWQQARLHLANIMLIALALAAAVWLLKKRAWWLRLFK